MRILNPGSSSRAPSDRNPLNKGNMFFSAGLAPHGNTNRVTYTVPTGRKAILELLFCLIARVTVAAPVGLAKIAPNYQPFGGSTSDLATCYFNNNTVDAFDRTIVTPSAVFYPGDLLNISTQDGSTGGTILYDLTMKLTEYDA